MASATDVSCTTINEVIEEIEDHIQSAPALDVRIGDPLTGPDTLASAYAATSLEVSRESTTNLNDYRNQNLSRVEDIIAVRVQRKISPKNQKGTRNELYALVDQIRNRLTQLSFRRQWTITHLDTLDETDSTEWFVSTIRFSTRRYETLGL